MEYKRVYATIDLDAVISNMEAMKGCLPQDTKIMGIVKADGYGHGSVPIARAIDSFVWGYGVATIEEALILRNHEITKPILVLGVVHESAYEAAIKEQIRLNIFTMEQAEALAAVAKNLDLIAKIHISVDTGMNRVGLAPNTEGAMLVAQIDMLEGIEIEGVFTHFAKADEMEKDATVRQLDRFHYFIEEVSMRGCEIPICHAANSAGIMEVGQAHMDMVRAGISMYGMYPSDEVDHNTISLTPVMEIKSRITYIKTILAGSQVSYGGTFVANHEMQIATIPVGYGDGYPRNLSNKGHVLIHGQKAPILGRVCMDQFMVDVTHISEAKVDDEVTLLGKDGDEIILVEDLASIGGGFHYEIVCDIGKRVPRVFVKDGVVIGKKDYFHDIY